MTDSAPESTRPLGALRRGAGSLATWALLVLATPGALFADGSATLAAVALVPWGLTASRPGRWAFGVELGAGFLGMTGLCWWVSYVWVGTLLTVGLMPAVWMACGGVVLRRLVRGGLGLLWAVPLAWIFADTLRHFVEPPFSFGWMRHGQNLLGAPLFCGSARLWGIGGLGFALAAVSGGVCAALRAREGGRRGVVLVMGLAPLALCALITFLTRPTPVVDGPQVLCVQPAIEQRRKQSAGPIPIFEESLRLTEQELRRLAAAGEEPPDLVCWAETMFPYPLLESGLDRRVGEGLAFPPWHEPAWTPEFMHRVMELERHLLQGPFFGLGLADPADRLLPEGTSLLVGAEYYLEHEGLVRRANAAFLFGPDGERGPAAGKRHLVPGGESMLGLERFAWVRDAAHAVAGYVPDMLAFDEVVLQELVTRGGDRVPFGASVCFDNLYDDLYVEPLRDGRRLDFHLIVSNEAWFRGSWEMDQMVAFSKGIALISGRSVVRVTNSGVTCVIGPDGRERVRLEVAGEDRQVAGVLSARVPVPEAGAEASFPPFVRLERCWLGLWMGLPLLLALVLGRRSVTGPAGGAREAQSAERAGS